jgi:hypothetical protein
VILEGMEDLGVYWVTRKLIYWALRCFGCIAWCANQREKAAKHIRVIEVQDWPTSATTKWEDLRQELESR